MVIFDGTLTAWGYFISEMWARHFGVGEPVAHETSREREIERVPTVSGWGTGTELPLLILGCVAGWCSHERARLYSTLSPSTMFVIGDIKRPQKQRDHSQCSEDSCASYTVDDKEHRTARNTGCLGCEFLGPKENDIRDANLKE